MNSRFIKELKSKVKCGMYSKVDKGGYPGHVPVGYLNDRIEKKIVKDPEMCDKVSALWRKALTGIYTVSGLTRIWGGKIYSGNHPCMISEAEFEKVQEMLKLNHNCRSKNPYDFILRGMFTCSECGYAIVTERKFKKLRDGAIKEYHYCYCCGKNTKNKCKFKSTYIREEELVKQIKDELCKYTIDEDFCKLAIEALAEED